jgi:hypothetical protein
MRRETLLRLVSRIVKDVREKLVRPASQDAIDLSDMKTTTAALDIIPEMFIVERSLFE